MAIIAQGPVYLRCVSGMNKERSEGGGSCLWSADHETMDTQTLAKLLRRGLVVRVVRVETGECLQDVVEEEYG